MIKNPVSTRLSESEREQMEKCCEEADVTPSFYLREKYRKGVEDEALELALLHALKQHRKQVENAIEESQEKLLKAFDQRLEKFQLQLFRTLEERLEILVDELKES